MRLQQIRNLNLKSFDNYSGPLACDFERANVFFAPNGRGKSSLAKGLYHEYLKSGNAENIRIYDDQFVAEHLLLEDGTGNIKGVKASFGKKDVELEKELKLLDGEIGDTLTRLTGLGAANVRLIAAAEGIIEDAFQRLKGQASISRKSHKDGVYEKVIQLWVDEYEIAAKKFPGQNFNLIDGTIDFSVALDLINSQSVSVDINIKHSDLLKIGSICSSEYRKIDIPEAAVVEWAESGLDLHIGKEICEFCHGKIDFLEVSKRVNAYAHDEMNASRKVLRGYLDELEKFVHDLRRLVGAKDSILAALEKDVDTHLALENISLNLSALENFAQTVSAKFEDMSVPMQMNIESTWMVVEAINANIAVLSKAKEKYKKLYHDKINRREMLVKGAIGYEVKTHKTLTENKTQYFANLEEIKKLEQLIVDKRERVRLLKESKSELSDFAGFINEVFADVGLDFKVIVEDKSYSLQHRVSGSALMIDDISEGERNLLSLIYFYFEMLSSDKKIIKSDIEIVIIDDPTSSMDDENRFYIIELVKAVMNAEHVQSFILTHSWNDYCNICFGKQESQGVRKFEILKHDGKSSIELSRSIVTPYKQLYKEINDFAEKEFRNVSPNEILHMPNTMRRILEEYIRFNFGIDLATQAQYDDIANCLFEVDSPTQVSATGATKLKTLLSVCNVLSHGVPKERNASEIHQSARFLMNRIRDINKHHHTKMKQ